jgi:GNAT superfamily N-acetyltransferase
VIRRARPDEVIDVRWAVLRAGRPRETAVFSHDDTGFHWVDDDNGAIVGVASVIPAPWPEPPLTPTPGLQLRGMAVLPNVRGTGRGAALLTTLQRDLAVPLWCNARVEVTGFYTAHGWISHGGLIEIPGVGLHQRMTWTPTW